MLMDQVETLHVCGYWSEILCCTITTHLSNLEVKVIDFDKFSGKAQVRRATLFCDSSYWSVFLFRFSPNPSFKFLLSRLFALSYPHRGKRKKETL